MDMPEGHPSGESKGQGRGRGWGSGSWEWAAVSPDKAGNALGTEGRDHARRPGRDRSTTARPFLLEKSIHCSLPFSSLHVIRQWPPVSPKPKVSPKTAIILHPHGQPGPFHPLLCPPGGSHCLLLPRLSQSQTKTGHAGGNLREAAHGAALT